MQTVSLRLPDDLLARLENEAQSRHVTKSEVVRASLEDAFRKGRTGREASCYDLARDLVGSIHGLPRDLADNPKYLKGFGK